MPGQAAGHQRVWRCTTQPTPRTNDRQAPCSSAARADDHLMRRVDRRWRRPVRTARLSHGSFGRRWPSCSHSARRWPKRSLSPTRHCKICPPSLRKPPNSPNWRVERIRFALLVRSCSIVRELQVSQMRPQSVELERHLNDMTELLVRLQNRITDRDERGAAMAEYGLLLALIALAAIAVLALFGGSISDVFSSANNRLNDGIDAAAEEAAE